MNDFKNQELHVTGFTVNKMTIVQNMNCYYGFTLLVHAEIYSFDFFIHLTNTYWLSTPH